MRGYQAGSIGIGVAGHKDLYESSTVELSISADPQPSPTSRSKRRDSDRGAAGRAGATSCQMWSRAEGDISSALVEAGPKEKNTKHPDSTRSGSRLGKDRDRDRDKDSREKDGRPSSRLGGLTRKLSLSSGRARELGYWDENDSPWSPGFSLAELGGIMVKTDIVVGTGTK